MSGLDLSRPGPWTQLFPPALALMAHLERVTDKPVWTFGGGTVLMLRIGHRHSKDIDLFVDDPQYLGYLTPRLSDEAESITTDYEENAEFLKLYLDAGEIDVVVGQSLTKVPFEIVDYRGRDIRVETCAEIIAKKMWHRGHRAKARDLFDLCAVAIAEPEAIQTARPFMVRHGAAFLQLLNERAEAVRKEFEQIDAITEFIPFDACLAMAAAIIEPALEAVGRGPTSLAQ
ncbi:MAG: nucleotidyl transferase AbiEii/AbiGii toxin family protein [Alphaproteobacteria bacterium]|nr:MAG: nucleotidyl transferase AbiEii/AbiGii toxin family protein [Alphaproteobacteria bacterium]